MIDVQSWIRPLGMNVWLAVVVAIVVAAFLIAFRIASKSNNREVELQLTKWIKFKIKK